MTNTLADYNLGLVVLSYLVAVLGSLTGLFVASYIRRDDGKVSLRWIALGSLLIGGCAVWSMHFIGMLAFDPGVPIAYDTELTIASLVLAVACSFVGLYTVFRWHRSRLAWLVAGLVTGLGVASMHYVGMAAMLMPARMHYDPSIVALSVVIAILAATAALHIAVHIVGAVRHFSSLIMGVAVCGMHYTGMAAMSLEPTQALERARYFEGTFTPLTMSIAVTLAVVTACAIGGILATARRLSDAGQGGYGSDVDRIVA